jgi:hypothetical protein
LLPIDLSAIRFPKMNEQPKNLIIEGITLTGRAFRPSDWAERLCGVMSVFGADEQLRYSQHVRPIMMDGVRCVVLHGELATMEPRAYASCGSDRQGQ